jgi:hypothetical protein
MSKRQKPAQRRVAPSAAAAAAETAHISDPLAALDAAQEVAPVNTQAAAAAALRAELEEAQRREAEALQHSREKEALIRRQVAALLAEKGESGCQQMLVQVIQKVKKRESEVATAKKRGDAVARENEQLMVDYKKMQISAQQIESSLRILSDDTARIDAEMATAASVMTQRRDEVRNRIEGEVQELRRNLEKQAADDELLVAENAELRKQFDQERAAFDAAFREHEKGWSEKEQNTKQLIQKLSVQLNETQMLDARLMLGERELKQLHDEIAVYREQLTTYSTKFDGFDAIAMKSEDVEKIAQMQKKQLQEKYDTLEQEKKKANELKSEFEKEALQFRAKFAALKKKLLQLEKTRVNLEGKCRKEAENQLAPKKK